MARDNLLMDNKMRFEDLRAFNVMRHSSVAFASRYWDA